MVSAMSRLLTVEDARDATNRALDEYFDAVLGPVLQSVTAGLSGRILAGYSRELPTYFLGLWNNQYPWRLGGREDLGNLIYDLLRNPTPLPIWINLPEGAVDTTPPQGPFPGELNQNLQESLLDWYTAYSLNQSRQRVKGVFVLNKPKIDLDGEPVPIETKVKRRFPYKP